MNNRILLLGAAVSISLLCAASAKAQIGAPYIHDPSSIVKCDGKYYTFGTRGGGLVSEDGWHWYSGGVRPGGGVAPDVMKIGDRYLVLWAVAPDDGVRMQYKTTIYSMWTKTLDPESPDFGYSDPIEVAKSTGYEDCDAIDPGLLMDPTTGRLWCVYGTYFGHLRIVEMDPETGGRMAYNEPVDVGRNCEAADLIYKDGWYYLLATHGTCCDGVNSTYNIIVGRSRNVLGPYIDNVGRSLNEGGGRSVLSSEARRVGPGHFGLYVEEEGVEKMSFHWEADMDFSGRSVLGIRPLIWKNGWPEAGDEFQEGTYEIETLRAGYALELAVEFIYMPGGARGFGATDNEPIVKVKEQTLDDVIGTWPKGNIDMRNGYYMSRPHQRWTVTAVPDAGGYLGAPYYKITIAGTNRALAATSDAEVVAVPEYTGADEQLWRIDQLTDGTFRIMPKKVPGHSETLALVSLGDATPTLARFDFNNDNCKWNFKKFTPLK